MEEREDKNFQNDVLDESQIESLEVDDTVQNEKLGDSVNNSEELLSSENYNEDLDVSDELESSETQDILNLDANEHNEINNENDNNDTSSFDEITEIENLINNLILFDDDSIEEDTQEDNIDLQEDNNENEIIQVEDDNKIQDYENLSEKDIENILNEVMDEVFFNGDLEKNTDSLDDKKDEEPNDLKEEFNNLIIESDDEIEENIEDLKSNDLEIIENEQSNDYELFYTKNEIEKFNSSESELFDKDFENIKDNLLENKELKSEENVSNELDNHELLSQDEISDEDEIENSKSNIDDEFAILENLSDDLFLQEINSSNKQIELLDNEFLEPEETKNDGDILESIEDLEILDNQYIHDESETEESEITEDFKAKANTETLNQDELEDENLDEFVVDNNDINLLLGEESFENENVVAENNILDSAQFEINEDQLIVDSNASEERDDEVDSVLNTIDINAISKSEEIKETEIIKEDIDLDNEKSDLGEEDEVVSTESDIENTSLESKDKVSELSEEDTIKFLQSNTFSKLDNEKTVKSNEISEDDTLEFLLSSELVSSKENAISEENTLSYLEKGEDVTLVVSSISVGYVENGGDEPPTDSENKEENSEENQTKEEGNQVLVGDGYFIPEEEIYLEQARIDPSTKFRIILCTIFACLSLGTLFVGIGYVIYIAKAGGIVENAGTYTKNLVLIGVFLALFNIIHNFLKNKLDDRLFKTTQMLKDRGLYKSINNFLEGEPFERRVKLARKYILFDLVVKIATFVFLALLIVPAITVNGKTYSLLLCCFDGIKKITVYFVRTFLLSSGMNPDIDTSGFVNIYNDGAISAIKNVFELMFSTDNQSGAVLITMLFSFVGAIFIAVGTLKGLHNVFLRLVYLMRAKRNIINQDIRFTVNEYRGQNPLIDIIKSILQNGFCIIFILIMIIGLTAKNGSDYTINMLYILIIPIVSIVVAIVFFVLKKVLFRKNVELDSGLWFFEKYRPWLRLKYRKQIREDALNTETSNLEKYQAEKRRERKEKMKIDKSYGRKMRIRFIIRIIIIIAIILFLIYVVIGVADFFGLFHRGTYDRGTGLDDCIRLSSVGKFRDEDNIISFGPDNFDKDQMTYRIVGDEIIIYGNGMKLSSSKIEDGIIYYETIDMMSLDGERTITYMYKKVENSSLFTNIYYGIRGIFKPLTKTIQKLTFK